MKIRATALDSSVLFSVSCLQALGCQDFAARADFGTENIVLAHRQSDSESNTATKLCLTKDQQWLKMISR
jgi:hypothetical protein